MWLSSLLRALKNWIQGKKLKRRNFRPDYYSISHILSGTVYYQLVTCYFENVRLFIFICINLYLLYFDIWYFQASLQLIVFTHSCKTEAIIPYISNLCSLTNQLSNLKLYINGVGLKPPVSISIVSLRFSVKKVHVLRGHHRG